MKSLTPKPAGTPLSTHLARVQQGIEQALAWIDNTRQSATLLDLEADSLSVRLRRCASRTAYLAATAQKPLTLGFYGQSREGKSYLINALATDASGKVQARLGGRTLDCAAEINLTPHANSLTQHLVTRFTHQPVSEDKEFPLHISLLAEVDLGRLIANLFLQQTAELGKPLALDEAQVIEHVKNLHMLRQSGNVAGMTANEVVDFQQHMARHDRRRHRVLATHFWPAAIELAPSLNIEERARLFSVLWNEQPAFTQAYRHYAEVLQHLSNAPELLAPVALLNAVDRDSEWLVLPMQDGHSGKAVSLTLDEITLLGTELCVPLHTLTREFAFETVDLLNIPGYRVADPAENLPFDEQIHNSKRSYLLEYYTEKQAINLLLVCTAARARRDAKAIGNLLDYWVKQTQGENAQIRSRRKPGLIWVLTPFDQRLAKAQYFDEAVQRYVGNPGDSWGSLLASDARGLERMVTYLISEIGREIKRERLDEQLHEIQRELTDNLLGSWAQAPTAEDPQHKQRISETLLKALQSRTGVHGELLERLLPSREELRRLYLQQQTPHSATPHDSPAFEIADPFGLNLNIDLFSEMNAEENLPTENDIATKLRNQTDYALNVQRYWINHLRNLPENAPLIELLGVGKATVELLVAEMITAAYRLGIEQSLAQVLGETETNLAERESAADRQVSRVLSVLGDFVAWLGFLHVPEAQRPLSRVNRGAKIFSQPAKQELSWGAAQRLTKLAATPTNTTAFYIYDWLVGLNEMIVQNAGYSASREISDAQRKALGKVMAMFR
ncbi:virulence factor [Rahnella sp. SAP-1]|uniref:Virulence factor n=1 Tax=Rouxiella aceris TaxID=2703884 RepID=A0A848MLJ4_9GAMM|nr:virulence factor SrfC family protein [Rouxiella aceris]NMP29267.1 virulence factor [Rouxiella aceris]